MYLLTKLAKYKIVMAIVLSVVFATLLAPALPASAAVSGTTDAVLNFGLSYGEDTGLGNKDLRSTISQIINVALSLLGIVAVVIILIGGFKWMTAGGNDENVTEARKWIFSGIIGLAIILSAFAVARFVLEQLYTATKGGTYTETGLT